MHFGQRFTVSSLFHLLGLTSPRTFGLGVKFPGLAERMLGQACHRGLCHQRQGRSTPACLFVNPGPHTVAEWFGVRYLPPMYQGLRV